MTSQEFVIWLKGMIAGAPQYQPNPQQWKVIKEELDKVGQQSASITFSSSTGNIATTDLANRTDITYTTKQQLND
jgi:hypothetical protein